MRDLLCSLGTTIAAGLESMEGPGQRHRDRIGGHSKHPAESRWQPRRRSREGVGFWETVVPND